MKLRNEKSTKLALIALTFSLLSGAPVVYAQDDALLADTEMVLNSQKIDIDGNWKTHAPKPRKLTNSQLIKQARKKSTRNNIKQISKEIEQIQVSTEQIEDILKKEDARLTNGVDAAFGGGTLSDSVSHAQAASQSVKHIPEVKPAKQFKIITSVGVTQISGEAIDFESKVNAGLAFEADISSRFAVGVGLNYTTLNVKEIDNNSLYNGFNNNCGYYACTGYNQFYGNQGRQLSYKHFNLEINGKFFITSTESKVRPYVGLGIGYNRTNLKYDDTQDSSNGNGNGYYNSTYNFQYGGEAFSSSYVSGSALVGTEINFTESFGLNLDVKYTKGLSKGFGTKSTAASAFNRDQEKLDRIGKDIEGSDFLSISGGVIIKF